MALEVGSGGSGKARKDREAAAVRPKAAPRSPSKAIRNPTTRPSRPSRLEPTPPVRATRRPVELEREPNSVPSDRTASRELVRQQGSISRDLVGPRNPQEPSEGSNEGGFFGAVVDTVRGAVDTVTGLADSGDSEGSSLLGDLFDRGREVVAGAVERSQEREADETRQAQEAYQSFSQDPEALRNQLGEEGLGQFTDAERLAIAQLSQENEAVGTATERAVNSDIADYENFADIPTDQATQILLNAYAGDEEAERLGTFLEDHLNSELDGHIERLGERGQEGDAQADGAIESLLSDAEDLARTHPALAGQLFDRFNSALESSAEQITDVRRNDDNWAQRVGHTVSGGVRSLAGGLGDGLRFAVRGAGEALDFPQQLGADLLSGATELGGDLAGAGLEAVGADGAADFVRDTSGTVSEGIQTVSDFQSEITEDVFIGVGEGVGVAVEGIGEALANPVGTVQGLATLANAASPLSLPLDIIRNGGNVVETVQERTNVFVGLGQGIASTYQATNEEHGGVAATSHAVFDIVTTIGTGGITAGGRTAATVATRLGNISQATRFVDDVARLGDDAARLADDAARLGDNAVLLGDNLADDVAGAAGDLLDAADDLPASWTDDLDRAASNPFDPLVRSQIRSPGFPQNAEFLQAINSSVDDLARRFSDNPNLSLREVIDDLTDSDIANWRRAGDEAPDAFFEPRTVGDEVRIDRTPVTGRYADATGPFGNVGERVADLIDGGPNTTTIAGSEATTLTNLYGPSILHAPAGSIDNILGAADDAFRRALDPATALDDTILAVGEVNWHIAQATPFTRGSAAAAEVVGRAIFDARGIASSAYRRGIAPDLEAFVSGLDDFTSRFADMFEVRPSFLP